MITSCSNNAFVSRCGLNTWLPVAQKVHMRGYFSLNFIVLRNIGLNTKIRHQVSWLSHVCSIVQTGYDVFKIMTMSGDPTSYLARWHKGA